MRGAKLSVKIYATCPQSKNIDRSRYLQETAEVLRWSEAAGCTGILVYTDNGIADPWLVSQIVIENTERLKPLIAIQPIYMHPFSAAKMVASPVFFYKRAVCLNMLAGGFKNDFLPLGDETPHDERYVRTIEYTQIMMGLLKGDGPITMDGRYYRVTNLRMTPALPAELVPEVLISGSSPAGLAAARTLGATPVKYPRPPGEEIAWVGDDPIGSFGVRVGIIVRATAEEAWRIANERFPEDRKGKITHRLTMQIFHSHWRRQLSQRREKNSELGAFGGEPDPYLLGPFQTYKTFCPYLVGNYERVGQLLAQHITLGCQTCILDIPTSEEELGHIGIVFDGAQQAVGVS